MSKKSIVIGGLFPTLKTFVLTSFTLYYTLVNMFLKYEIASWWAQSLHTQWVMPKQKIIELLRTWIQKKSWSHGVKEHHISFSSNKPARVNQPPPVHQLAVLVIGRAVFLHSGSWPCLNLKLHHSQPFWAADFWAFLFYGCFFPTLTILPFNIITLILSYPSDLATLLFIF